MGHGDEQVEDRMFVDVLEQFCGPVFGIGEHEWAMRVWVEDVGGKL